MARSAVRICRAVSARSNQLTSGSGSPATTASCRRARSALRCDGAAVLLSTSDDTRSGALRTSCWATIPPNEVPHTCAVAATAHSADGRDQPAGTNLVSGYKPAG